MNTTQSLFYNLYKVGYLIPDLVLLRGLLRKYLIFLNNWLECSNHNNLIMCKNTYDRTLYL